MITREAKLATEEMTAWCIRLTDLTCVPFNRIIFIVGFSVRPIVIWLGVAIDGLGRVGVGVDNRHSTIVLRIGSGRHCGRENKVENEELSEG